MTSSITVGSFSPSTLSGCVLWLDGGDLSSITLSGSSVLQWTDKSGVGNNGTGGVSPTYASGGVVFNGTNQYLQTNLTAVPSNESIFCVFNLSGSATNRNYDMIAGSANNSRGFQVLNTGSGFFLKWDVWAVAGYAPTAGGSVVVGTTTLGSGTYSAGPTNGSGTTYVNGGTFTGGPATFSVSGAGTTRIGSGNGGDFFQGTIYEVVSYNNVLTTFGRQQVEGYLAWKWGLQTSLPTTHPYRYYPFLVIKESVPRSIPSNAFLLPVSTYSTIKTFTLPVVSTNPGRVLILKDYLGYANSNIISLSTIGLDRIERSNVSSMTLSNAYGAWWFQNDGISKWFLTSAYLNSLTIVAPEVGLSVLPAVRYSFLSANYSGSGNVNNIGSNTGVGSATVSRNSYTSANPGFITNIRAGNYVYTPSVTFRTIIMIVRIRDTSSPSYLLDGRNGMGNGWIYNDGYGSDWNGTTYYRDAVLTAFPTNLPTPLNDSQWRHVTLVAPANYTTQMTFANRFSFNEGFGGDISELMMFTQLLTLQQVKDNFNFFATRFGWTPVS